MMVARFGIGFGGLITPFCTLECLCKLFPDDFMLMAGIRNLVQSASGFFAFVVLPWIQRTYLSEDTLALNAEDFDGSVSLFSAEQDDPDYNHGTTMALHFCFFCGILSLTSNVTVYLCFMKDGAAGDLPVQKDLAAQVRGLAGAITPKSPSSCDQWKLPLSFYIAIYGIQSQYFAPFSFSSFSNKIYMNRYGANAATASFYSGVMNLIGGLVGPILGPVSDAYGNRALMLGGFGVLSAIGFALIGSSSEINLWIPTILFALQYGFGDTVAYPNIRLLVGPERAGIGYGIAGSLCGVIAVAAPMAGGVFMDMDDPNKPLESGVNVAWFFAGTMVLSTLVWLVVHVLEGPKSAIVLPAKDLVETEDLYINSAALVNMGNVSAKKLPDSSSDVERATD
jgi:nitrate/nitrite transporter NarK